MIQQIAWFERRFTFDHPIGAFPGVIERLRGTPARLEERTRGIARDVLTDGRGGWSVLEQIGHFGDLEPLWDTRLTDLLKGAAVMTDADLTNRATHQADHNAARLADLLARFRGRRAAFVARLEPLGERDVARSALHPRLRTPMRTLDLALFVAEHDDHHLARISELLRS